MTPLDPVGLTQALIRCRSVTPADDGALDVVAARLAPFGFACRMLDFGEGPGAVRNLYARFGTGGPHFCFAGHTDVVPPGPAEMWRHPPFAAEIADGRLYGRGAADMKSAVAAFAVAACRFAAARPAGFKGSISLLITGDEEADAVNGTDRVLDWLAARGETIDACLVGEPTSRVQLGDMMKIGRRGSLSGRLTVHGVQGHSAYPQLADNPLPRLVRTLAALTERPLDEGSDWFQPSTLVLTSIDVGNPAGNVIPAAGEARFNIRFNDRHSSGSLERWLREVCAAHAGRHELAVRVSGESFLTEPGPLSRLVAAAVRQVTGLEPEASTSGGTSDARFIRRAAPVVEFGLVGQTIHQVDEHVAVADITRLTEIYGAILDGYFAGAG